MSIMNVYKYMPLRIMPDIETGEFVNIGVVMLKEFPAQLCFRVEWNQVRKRVLDFFDQVDSRIIGESVSHMVKSLEYHCQRQDSAVAFRALAAMKEGLVQFGGIRGIVSEKNMPVVLDELFETLVEIRSQPRSDGVREITNGIKAVLAELELVDRYKAKVYENAEGYRLRIPFAYEDLKAATPVNLARRRYNDIKDQTILWVERFNMLEACLPKKVIVAYRLPSETVFGRGTLQMCHEFLTHLKEVNRIECIMADDYEAMKYHLAI